MGPALKALPALKAVAEDVGTSSDTTLDRNLGVPAGPAVYGPIYELQAAYDELLVRPWRFPEHLQRIRQVVEAQRTERQALVDQSNLDAGCSALLTARMVVYAIVGRDNPRVQVCVTRYSCAQDFLERSAREAQKMLNRGSRPPKRRRGASAKNGLVFQSPEGLLLIPLESLSSPALHYHKIANPRLHHWAELLHDLDTSLSRATAGKVVE